LSEVVNLRRVDVLNALGLPEPWDRAGESSADVDLQGWNSGHPYLFETVDDRPAPIIVEVGVWKGASTIAMADRVRSRGADGVVIAVDTFLGSAEHYLNAEWKRSLRLKGGQPHLFDTFVANVRAAGLEDFIVPLPLDSVNASVLVASAGVPVDIVHIDAGHDVDSVSQDLRLWFDLLAPGGWVICDDYTAQWPGVVAAVSTFTMGREVEAFEAQGGKCRFRKPAVPSAISPNELSGHDLEHLPLARAVVERDVAIQRAAELEQDLAALHASRSWRWTQWARSLVG
jgi:predicted O-methyltransferase YrrM